jgi:hypothetical protein
VGGGALFRGGPLGAPLLASLRLAPLLDGALSQPALGLRLAPPAY